MAQKARQNWNVILYDVEPLIICFVRCSCLRRAATRRLSELSPQLAERSEAGTPTGDNTFCGLRLNQNLLFAALYAIIKP